MRKLIKNKFLRSIFMENETLNFFPFFGRELAKRKIRKNRENANKTALFPGIANNVSLDSQSRAALETQFAKAAQKTGNKIMNPKRRNILFARSERIKKIELFLANSVSKAKNKLFRDETKSSNSFAPNQNVSSLTFQKQNLARFLLPSEHVFSRLSNKQLFLRRTSNKKNIHLEKKKLKILYASVKNNYFKKIRDQGKTLLGTKNHNFLILLERRLDITLQRAGFFTTQLSANQMITRGHVFVNNKKVLSPAYLTFPGDIIKIDPLNLIESNNINRYLRKTSQESLNDNAYTTDINEKIKRARLLTVNQDAFSQKELSSKNFAWRFRSSPFLLFCLQNLLLCKSSSQTLVATREVLSRIESAFLPLESLSRKERFILELKKQLILQNSLTQHFIEQKSTLLDFWRSHSNPRHKDLKPLHLEVSYKSLSIVVLFAPQRVFSPSVIDWDLIFGKKSNFK